MHFNTFGRTMFTMNDNRTQAQRAQAQRRQIEKMQVQKYSNKIAVNVKMIKEYIIDSRKFKSGNALFLAVHSMSIEKTTRLILNNLINLKIDDIDNIIIAISLENKEHINKFVEALIYKIRNKNIIFIMDIENKYYDFGKYKIAYDYFKKKGMSANYIHIMNDSFIICEKIDTICDDIRNKIKDNDFVGVAESMEEESFQHNVVGKQHYQSWWMLLKNSIYDEYFNKINLIDTSGSFTILKRKIIVENEIGISNYFITNPKYNTSSIIKCPGNIFIPRYTDLYNKLWNIGFKIIKMEAISDPKKQPLPYLQTWYDIVNQWESTSNTYFLLDIDKYYKGMGFCNQMFYILNSIQKIFIKNVNNKNVLFVKGMKSDMFNQTRSCIDKFFDIENTNNNLLHSKKCIRLVDWSEYNKYNNPIVTTIDIDKLVTENWTEKDIELYKLFVPNKELLHIKNTIQPSTSYSTIHFRLDVDCVLHYCYNDPATRILYDPTFNLGDFCTMKDISSSIRYTEKYITRPVIQWIDKIYSQYILAINKHGIHKHYYICTPIIRDPRHKLVENYLYKLLNYLPNKTFIKEPFHHDREISAYIELEIINKSDGLIGFEGSTFSGMGNKLTKHIYSVTPYIFKK